MRINGGYFVLRQGIFDYLDEGDDLVMDGFVRAAADGRCCAVPLRRVLGADGHAEGARRLEDLYRSGISPGALGGTVPSRSPVMRGLSLKGGSPLRLLCVGAHPTTSRSDVAAPSSASSSAGAVECATFVILTGDDVRQGEARAAAELFLPGTQVVLRCSGLPDGRLPAHWDAVKAQLEEVAAEQAFDLVLVPSSTDAHQDHRLLAEIAPTVWRDHLILGYELPKYDGDLGRPSLYFPLSEDLAREKVRRLAKAYASQVDRDWWDEETFLGLARLRGMECRSRYAEAFTVNKATLSW